MRPLCLVGTHRNVGKTTLSIGLSRAFRERGLRVGYCKPLGQRVKKVEGHDLHDDALVVSRILGDPTSTQVEMAVPLPSGRVEREVFDLHTNELLAKVQSNLEALSRDHDIVLIESMGHVAMGSCLGLSAAEVIRAVNGRALLVSGGGIGRAIDDIVLCGSFLSCRGADLMGVVVNKVWPEKYVRIKKATTQGLENLGIRSYGVVPYEQGLSSPTMRQVLDLVHGELISGAEHIDNRVDGTIIAAMESSHMVRYLKDSTLVITPGDRSDNILAALTAHMLASRDGVAVAGLVLTGSFRPDGTLMKLINESHLPVVLVKEDTYTIASRFRETVFKIRPEDERKISAAICLVAEYVDVEAIIEGLQD